MYPYRVFVSYSHDDGPIADVVRARLEEIGGRPTLDADISGGAKFTDEIRHGISHAHVFISILTANSKSRPWVHQEIGYAMGLGVPILPLALDELPEGMTQEIQAVRTDRMTVAASGSLFWLVVGGPPACATEEALSVTPTSEIAIEEWYLSRTLIGHFPSADSTDTIPHTRPARFKGKGKVRRIAPQQGYGLNTRSMNNGMSFPLAAPSSLMSAHLQFWRS